MKIVYLKVIWKMLFSTSSRDHGTLGHLCSLLGRLPNAKDPHKDFNACSDVLFTILKGHFIYSSCLWCPWHQKAWWRASDPYWSETFQSIWKKSIHISSGEEGSAEELCNWWSSSQQGDSRPQWPGQQLCSCILKGTESASLTAGVCSYSTSTQLSEQNMHLKHFVWNFNWHLSLLHLHTSWSGIAS